ncbi:MAG: copper chaperone PCu(A)C [Pseudomonadales bacterium]|nr:copper chaperone PCu(A)C [Pseudomonadales bacterium]
MLRLTPWLFALALLGLSACAPAPTDGPDLVAEAGWIRQPPPGQRRSAAYLTLKARTAVTLVAAESPYAERVEFHTMVKEGELMRMRPLPNVTLKPREARVFAPGGDHLMLFGWAPPPGTTTAEVHLLTEAGTRHTLTLPIGEP